MKIFRQFQDQIESMTLGIIRKYLEERHNRFTQLLNSELDPDERNEIVKNIEVMNRMFDEVNNYKAPV